MKILLAVDESPCAEAAVQAVLSQFAPSEHEIRVFQAVDWEPQLPMSYQFSVGPHAAADVHSARDEMVQRAHTFVSRMADRLRAHGFAITTAVSKEGPARDAIVQAAEAWPADLIVVGSHGRSGVNRMLLGSVAEGVARRAHCSVQIARATSRVPGAASERRV